MSELTVVDRLGVLVIDSRLIAVDLKIQHKNLLATIDKFLSVIETAFERVAFETITLETEGGKQSSRIAWITEEQATFIMTLSRNTAQVIQCKVNLVKAFTLAKKMLQSTPSPAMTQIQMLAAIAQQMSEQEQRLLEQERISIELTGELEVAKAELSDRIKLVEFEQDRFNHPSGHKYTILGFAKKQGLEISLNQSKSFGSKASSLCRTALHKCGMSQENTGISLYFK